MAEVYVSTVLNAPAERVWRLVRDFDALPDWVPGVVDSRIEGGGPADRVGCVRAFRLADGGALRERLLALSDYDYACTYAILDSPMPVTGYVATLRLIPVTDGNRTFAEWSARFECDPEDEPGLVEAIGEGVFGAAFDALVSRFGG